MTSTLREVQDSVERIRHEYAAFAAEAKRRKVPVFEVASIEKLQHYRFQLEELIKDSEGRSITTYNTAVAVFNAVNSDLDGAPPED